MRPRGTPLASRSPRAAPGGSVDVVKPRSVASVDVRNEAPAGAVQIFAIPRVLREEPLLDDRADIQRDQGRDGEHDVLRGRIRDDVSEVAEQIAAVRRMSHHPVEAGRLDPPVGRHDADAPTERGESSHGRREPQELERLAEPRIWTWHLAGTHEERKQGACSADDPVPGTARRGKTAAAGEEQYDQ